jgi:hypothetical protein
MSSLDDSGRETARDRRVADIEDSLRDNRVPSAIGARLEAARDGRLPWVATLTPAELLAVRSHGLRPIAAVSATCWLHHGWSWTDGHTHGWETALKRLRAEARAAGANAVLDVKMRTIPLHIENSTDFTLVGTAVRVEGLPPSLDPIVATVPALEFVRLLEADVVATGIAIGAHYEWLNDWSGQARQVWGGNVESAVLSRFWEVVRQRAHANLRRSAASQGNGVLAHINFGQMLEFEGQNDQKRYLGRQIVIATTVDTPTRDAPRVTMPWGDPSWVVRKRGVSFVHDIKMMVDMRSGPTPLTGHVRHHQSYASNEEEGAI